MRLRPFILPAACVAAMRRHSRITVYTARRSISGSIYKRGCAACNIALPISRLAHASVRAVGRKGCLGEGLPPGLPDPQFHRPLIGLRALRAGLKVDIDCGHATVSVWVPE